MKKLNIISMILIILNAILIGLETSYQSSIISQAQTVIMLYFVIELVIRFIISKGKFFRCYWNLFDLIVITLSILPLSSGPITLLRLFRVFRILRVLKPFKELNVMLAVLYKSFKALLFNAVLCITITYLYAILGVQIFRLDVNHANYEQLQSIAPNAPVNSPDPYGTISEASFTLFRLVTGEDWTDLRYNLISAAELEVIQAHDITITMYHISYYILSTILLLNLLLGAILSNYQSEISKDDRLDQILKLLNRGEV